MESERYFRPSSQAGARALRRSRSQIAPCKRVEYPSRDALDPSASPVGGAGIHDVRSETDALDKPQRGRAPSRSGLGAQAC